MGKYWWTLKPTASLIVALLSLCNIIFVIYPGRPSYVDQRENYDEKMAFNSRRYAIANFVEGPEQIYGLYSIHRQLAKHNMTNSGGVAHVAVVPSSIKEKFRHALVLWLGEDNIRTVDRGYISQRMTPDQKLWEGTFNKLWLFNLTEFDKVIMLDADILIRTNIHHWFDYPTPCAIQAGDDIAWNTGAMVIRPDTQVFERMVSQLPHIQKYDSRIEYTKDSMTGGYSDQDFVSAFFLNDTNRKELGLGKNRCVLPIEAAILTSVLRASETLDYYNKYRPWVYETVHFTVKKPWRTNHFERNNITIPTPPILCSLLREWNVSVSGIEEYYGIIPPLKNNYLKSCSGKGGLGLISNHLSGVG